MLTPLNVYQVKCKAYLTGTVFFSHVLIFEKIVILGQPPDVKVSVLSFLLFANGREKNNCSDVFYYE